VLSLVKVNKTQGWPLAEFFALTDVAVEYEIAFMELMPGGSARRLFAGRDRWSDAGLMPPAGNGVEKAAQGRIW
jgi:hypothetical protein